MQRMLAMAGFIIPEPTVTPNAVVTPRGTDEARLMNATTVRITVVPHRGSQGVTSLPQAIWFPQPTETTQTPEPSAPKGPSKYAQARARRTAQHEEAIAKARAARIPKNPGSGSPVGATRHTVVNHLKIVEGRFGKEVAQKAGFKPAPKSAKKEDATEIQWGHSRASIGPSVVTAGEKLNVVYDRNSYEGDKIRYVHVEAHYADEPTRRPRVTFGKSGGEKTARGFDVSVDQDAAGRKIVYSFGLTVVDAEGNTRNVVDDNDGAGYSALIVADHQAAFGTRAALEIAQVQGPPEHYGQERREFVQVRSSAQRLVAQLFPKEEDQTFEALGNIRLGTFFAAEAASKLRFRDPGAVQFGHPDDLKDSDPNAYGTVKWRAELGGKLAFPAANAFALKVLQGMGFKE